MEANEDNLESLKNFINSGKGDPGVLAAGLLQRHRIERRGQVRALTMILVVAPFVRLDDCICYAASHSKPVLVHQRAASGTAWPQGLRTLDWQQASSWGTTSQPAGCFVA